MDDLQNVVIEGVQMQDEKLTKRSKWAEATRQRRQDPLIRAKERMQNLIASRIRRQNPELREKERERNRLAMRLKRQNPEFRERERRYMAMRKMNPAIRESPMLNDPRLGAPHFEMGMIPNIQFNNPSLATSHHNIGIRPDMMLNKPRHSASHLPYKMCNCQLMEMEKECLANFQGYEENSECCNIEVNGSLPLEMEMRVEEEDVDDPDEVEFKPYLRQYTNTQGEMLPLPVEVTITPRIEAYNVNQEDSYPSCSLDTSTVHEEVDIKEEEGNKNEEEEVLQPPLVVNIKEEMRDEDEEEVVVEPSLPDYENYDDTSDEKEMPPISTVVVDGGADANTEEEILPDAAMVVVPGRAAEYPEGFVEENIAAMKVLNPSTKPAKWSRGTTKKVDTVYRCPNCSLCYTSPEYLAGHVRRGCRYRPSPIKNAYSCIVCGEGFNNYGDLYQHKRQKHYNLISDDQSPEVPSKFSRVDPAPRNYQCPDCPRRFTAPGYLVQHQRSHLRQRTDHFCDICGDSFLQKSRQEMNEHFAKMHPVSQVHRCEHCKRMYGQRQNLVTHLQAHGEFRCQICTKLFSTKQTLSTHLRGHACNPKQYKCKLCGKSYLQPGRFYEHRRREHGISEISLHPKAMQDQDSVAGDVVNLDDDDDDVDGCGSGGGVGGGDEDCDDDDDDDVQVISFGPTFPKSSTISEEDMDSPLNLKTEKTSSST